MLVDIRETIIRMDAALERGACGRLVVYDNQVELHDDDNSIISVLENAEIKVSSWCENGELVYHSITHQEALTVMSTDGWPLYAGKTSIVFQGDDQVRTNAKKRSFQQEYER